MRDRPGDVYADVQQVVLDTIEMKFAKESSHFVVSVQEYDSKTKEAICKCPDGTTRRIPISGQDKRIAKYVRSEAPDKVTNESSRNRPIDQLLVINAGYPGPTLDKVLAIPLDLPSPPKPTAEEFAFQSMIDEMEGKSPRASVQSAQQTSDAQTRDDFDTFVSNNVI